MKPEIERIKGLREQVAHFMNRLKVPERRGRFLPCLKGLTSEGEKVALGPSCFALKIYYMLGLWAELPESERREWLAFIKSFQLNGNPTGEPMARDAFVDSAVFDCLYQQPPLRKRLGGRIFGSKNLSNLQLTIIAETKQAIATLYEVGAYSDRPYSGFPMSSQKVTQYLSRFDWKQPWSAGAHFAALAVFLKTEAPRIMERNKNTQLLDACSMFIENKLDMETGGYFFGEIPEHGDLINGAMKVLTGLDWLEIPIHRPEKLIDTCLAKPPQSHGCHIVDAVYVLYRCLQQTDHGRKSVQNYCADVLEKIWGHFIEEDGAFSYDIGKSQSTYYGVPITSQLRSADIHGTVLLVWALAMIMEILEISHGWKIIKP